jgi:hypothetical protein
MECWDKLAVENYGYPLARTNWLLRLRRSKCFLIISESLAGCGLCSNYVGLAIFTLLNSLCDPSYKWALWSVVYMFFIFPGSRRNTMVAVVQHQGFHLVLPSPLSRSALLFLQNFIPSFCRF